MVKLIEYGTAKIGDAALEIYATDDYKIHVYEPRCGIDLEFETFDKVNDFFGRFFGVQLEKDYKLINTNVYGTPLSYLAYKKAFDSELNGGNHERKNVEAASSSQEL